MSFRSRRHFLQIPGPRNVPDRVLHATGRPTLGRRGVISGLLCWLPRINQGVLPALRYLVETT